MNGEVVSTGQGISVVEEIDQETTDTYAKAREVAEQQITKEQAVHDAHDAIESDVLGLWSEYIEIPYGDLTLRVKSDLPQRKHDMLKRSLQDTDTDLPNPYTESLLILTIGLYDGDELKQSTDETFWNNANHWSELKVQKIISGYFRNYKKEIEATTSFLGD